MARIKITEVPQAPSVAGAAPQAIDYQVRSRGQVPYASPNLPAIPQNLGSSARLQAPREINPAIYEEGAIDFEGKIAGLMQPQIDEGPVLAAGRASVRAAGALGAAGQAIGGAFVDLAQVGQALQQSKDMADISRANNFMALGRAAYEEEAVNVPLTERAKLWEEKYKPAVDQALSALKMSPYTADRIGPAWQLAQTKQRTEIATEARKEIIKQDEAAIIEELNRSVANGDWMAASDANARLTLGKHQTPLQQSARQKDINEAKTEWDVQQLINDNPRAALQEAEEVIAIGKSDIFPELKNPATAAKLKNAAREEVNRREVDASKAITNGIAAGSIKSKADIESVAAGNLTPDKIEAYNRGLLANPEYSSEAVVKAKAAIDAYDPKTDPDMSTWHAINEQISTTVSKTEQGPLTKALAERAEGKKPDEDPKQFYASSILKQFEELGDNGFFDPAIKPKSTILGIPIPFTGGGPKYDRDKARKDPVYAITHKDVEQAAWERVKTLQDSMRQWLVANPDASPAEAQEQVSKMLATDTAKSAATDMKPKLPEKAAVPTAPATPAGPPVSPPLSSARGEQHTVAKVTAYRPGGTYAMGVNPKVEGGPMDAHGNMILGNSTMEDYAEGRGNYVTVAMDKESDWQGKYLISAAYPGVVFKVMDNGGYGNGKTGRDWIDIAWKDPAMARKFTQRNITFEAIERQEAKRIAAARYSA